MATGAKWKSKLLYVQYEGTQVRARYEFFSDLSHVHKEHIGIFSVDKRSPLLSEIAQASAFTIDLPVKTFLPFKTTSKAFTHHIIELIAKSGEYFSLEKGQACILLQSCRRENEAEKPIIRHQRNGEERLKLGTLQRIAREDDPKAVTILDLLIWLDDKGNDGMQASRLMEPYHVADSNCQHFAAQLWHQLSCNVYPNPSLYPALSMPSVSWSQYQRLATAAANGTIATAS